MHTEFVKIYKHEERKRFTNKNKNYFFNVTSDDFVAG